MYSFKKADEICNVISLQIFFTGYKDLLLLLG